MNPKSARLLVVLSCVLVFVSAVLHQTDARALAKDITISKKDQTLTLDCNGGAVTIKSEDNKITLTGQCNKLSVSGEHNKIQATWIREIEISGHGNTIDVVNVAKISAKGKDNDITWKNGLDGKSPDISSNGDDNKIKQSN